MMDVAGFVLFFFLPFIHPFSVLHILHRVVGLSQGTPGRGNPRRGAKLSQGTITHTITQPFSTVTMGNLEMPVSLFERGGT